MHWKLAIEEGGGRLTSAIGRWWSVPCNCSRRSYQPGARTAAHQLPAAALLGTVIIRCIRQLANDAD